MVVEVSWVQPSKPNGEIKEYIVYTQPPIPPSSKFVSGKLRKTNLTLVLEDNMVEYKIMASNSVRSSARRDDRAYLCLKWSLQVAAKNEVHESAYSAECTIKVASLNLKKVADLRADGPTENSVTLSWRAQKPDLNFTITVSSLQPFHPYPDLDPIVTNETKYTGTFSCSSV